MENFIYLVILADKDGFVVQHVIKSISDLDKSRDIIRRETCLEFEETPSCYNDSYWKYNNIDDCQDKYLIVERVSIIG